MPWFWCLLVLAMVCATGFGGRLLAEDRAPEVTLPPLPAPPNPNAADYYLQASEKLQELAAKTTIGKPLWDPPTKPLDYTLEQREAQLTEMAPAAKLIREGQQYQCGLLKFNPDGSPDSSMLPRLRELERYLRFESETHIASGDWDAGISSALDGLHLGADTIQEGSLLYMLVGVALADIVRKDAWQCVDHLTTPQVQAASTRLQAIIARDPSLADFLTGWKIGLQRSLLDQFKQPNWRDDYIKIHKLAQGVQLTDGMKDIFQPLTKEMDQRIANAAKPYIERRNTPAPQNPLISGTFQNYDRTVLILARHQAQERLLLLACALRAYYLEHHAYPDTLQALVPAYLPKIPDDPFAAGTFCYRPDGKAYLLYSPGPDCKDDGGKPIQGMIDEKSTGDIVAGQNL